MGNTDIDIDRLVRLVEEKIKDLQSQPPCVHTAVLVKSEIPGGELFDRTILSMKEEGFVFTIPEMDRIMEKEGQSVKDGFICPMGSAAGKYAADHEVLVVENIPVGILTSILDLRIDSFLLDLIYQFLKLGKRVYAFSTDILLSGTNSPLEKKLMGILGELESWGVTVALPGRQCASVLNKENIKVSDIKDITGGALIVPSKAEFTEVAKRHLDERGIVIIRR